ncbi:caspase family protein [Nocardia yamanashiensis]|uniref:caspase family protein n=1 Tax=Nocardia yamanashiensis TaxID=209247 RepID=UPI001E621562|nr:caspase family protein [Nocardia yamanashiensis]UGT44538.1 caspase family protein [Nocardia yamanashiensis]
MPKLPATMNNIDDLAVCLRDEKLWGLPQSHCALVRNPGSRETVMYNLHDAADQAEDALIVYFTGHGLRDPDTGELLLGITDSVPGRTYTALPYDYIRRLLRDAQAPRRVVVLDCCYSGQAIAGMSNPVTTVVDEMSTEGTFVLASAPENKQALSPVGERHTAFTGELIRLLREGIPGGPEFISLQQVFTHTLGELIAKSRPRPQMRTRNTIGDLAIVRNPQWSRDGPDDHPDRESPPRIILPKTTKAPDATTPNRTGPDEDHKLVQRIEQLVVYMEGKTPVTKAGNTSEILVALGIDREPAARLAEAVDTSVLDMLIDAIRVLLEHQHASDIRKALLLGDIQDAATCLALIPARRRTGRADPGSIYDEIVEDNRNIIFGLVTENARWINEFYDPVQAWYEITRRHFPLGGIQQTR